ADSETERQPHVRIGQKMDKIRQQEVDVFRSVDPCDFTAFAHFVATLRNVTWYDILSFSDSHRDKNIDSPRWVQGWLHHLRKRIRSGIGNPSANMNTTALVDDSFKQATEHHLKLDSFGPSTLVFLIQKFA
ncbi:unnamed protein product, partial [Pylaiella littoralis]